MISLSLLILFLYFFYIDSYLNSYQWVKINNILTKPNFYTISQKQYINTLIFDNYQIWAINQCFKLKQFHYYKCRHISKHEIKLYAQIGLYKAIMFYNPSRLKNITFSDYAFIYIRSEFYKCITELHPITTASKHERRKGVFSRKNNTIIQIQSFSPVYQEINFNNYIMNNYNQQKNYLSYNDVWLKIEHDMPISNIIKKIIKLKFSYEFNQKRSNKEISEIMGCSEETIRKYIVQFRHELNNTLN